MSLVTDEELDRVRLLGELHRDGAGPLGHPARVRLGRHAGDPDEAHVVVDEVTLEPSHEHGVDAEEVAGEHALGLYGEELRPRLPRAPGRRFDAVALQDRQTLDGAIGMPMVASSRGCAASPRSDSPRPSGG